MREIQQAASMLFSMLLISALLWSQSAPSPEALEWFRQGEAMIETEEAYSPQQAACFESAVRLAPDFAAARYNLAVIYLKQQRFDLALEQLNALTPLEPDNPRSLLLRAEALFRTDRAVEAEGDLEKTVTLVPEDAAAWQQLGRVRALKGRFEAALEAQEKARGLQPDLEGIDFDLAATCQQLGKTAEAVAHAEEHLRRFPGDSEALVFLAGLHRQQGEKQKALQCLLEVERVDPSRTDLGAEIGFLYLELDQPDEAEKRLRAVDTAEALANLGLIARHRDRPAEAEGYFAKALQKQPSNGEFWAALGEAQQMQGKHEEARQSYEKARQLGVEDSVTLLNLGAVYANLDDNVRAAETLEKAIQADPSSGQAHFTLGVILERLDKSGQALAHYEKALENGYDDARLRFRMAVLFSRQGKTEEAFRHLEVCLDREAGKYVPLIEKELLNVHSDFDSIRYTARFADLLKKHKGEERPVP